MKTSSILIAVLIFGSLIFLHELGHYLFARLFHVKINEFAVGMGPKLLSRTSKKTGIRYSLRALPIGGFVSMDGEDDVSEHPDAYCRKPWWQRLLIALAGPAMNMLIGFIAMAVLVIGTGAVSTTVVADFTDNAVSNADGYLQPYDEIVRINGRRVYSRTGIYYAILYGRYEEGSAQIVKDGETVTVENAAGVDIEIRRDGETVLLENVPFRTVSESGITFVDPDFNIFYTRLSFGGVAKQTFFDSLATVELIWQSLGRLITGQYGLEAVSGPVGVTQAIDSVNTGNWLSIVYIFVLITMNLGAFNLIPFPALDGWRIFLLLFEAIFRKPLNKKVEGYVNMAGLILLFLLMIFVTTKDIMGLFK
ncbi:MAG: site-2 protease family protein [Clostridia bacterium]|nr:site-2 protease family protein [Clostridia bacterium]